MLRSVKYLISLPSNPHPALPELEWSGWKSHIPWRICYAQKCALSCVASTISRSLRGINLHYALCYPRWHQFKANFKWLRSFPCYRIPWSTETDLSRSSCEPSIAILGLWVCDSKTTYKNLTSQRGWRLIDPNIFCAAKLHSPDSSRWKRSSESSLSV